MVQEGRDDRDAPRGQARLDEVLQRLRDYRSFEVVLVLHLIKLLLREGGRNVVWIAVHDLPRRLLEFF